MKLLIIRHGDPDYARDTLTETGWQEAALLADRLEQLDVKAFYVSSMGRAKDTASLTLQRMGREAEVCDWLREFIVEIDRPDCGRSVIAWDWLPADWTVDKRFYDPERWQEPEAFQNSAMAAHYSYVCSQLDSLLAGHGYLREGKYYRAESPNENTVVLFCHFGLTCVLLSHLLGIPPMPLWQGTCSAPTSVTTLVTEERREGIAAFRMTGFGDISHLYVAGQQPSASARFCEVFTAADQRHD